MSVYTFLGVALYSFPDEARYFDAHARELATRWHDDGQSKPDVLGLRPALHHHASTPGDEGVGRRLLWKDERRGNALLAYRYGDTAVLVGIHRPHLNDTATTYQHIQGLPVDRWKQWFLSPAEGPRPYQCAFTHLIETTKTRRPSPQRHVASGKQRADRLAWERVSDGEYLIHGPKDSRWLHDWCFEESHLVRLLLFDGKVQRYRRELGYCRDLYEKAPHAYTSANVESVRQKARNVRTAADNFRAVWKRAFGTTRSELLRGHRLWVNDGDTICRTIDNGRRQAHMPRDQTFDAGVAFIGIKGLKTLGADVPLAIASLHAATRAELQRKPWNTANIKALSALNGVILAFPDSSSTDCIGLAKRISQRFDTKGLLRVGISHGRICSVTDLDGTKTVIGEPINTAARLAFAQKNTRCLVHEKYARHFVNATAYLEGQRSLTVPGKSHDKPFRCIKVPDDEFVATSSKAGIQAPPSKRRAVNGIVISYDLPKFSSGSLSAMISRFNGVVGKIGQSITGRDPSTVFLSPGGDGGIIVIGDVDTKSGYRLANEILGHLDVENLLRTKKAGVECRVGVHYGQVWLYQNAAGHERPTGEAIFIADEMTGDKRARTCRSVVFSEALKAAVAETETSLASLGPLRSGAAKGIGRYVRAVPR